MDGGPRSISERARPKPRPRGPRNPATSTPRAACYAASRRSPSRLGKCTDNDDLFCRHLGGTVLPRVRALRAIAEPGREFRALRRQKDWGPGTGGTDKAWPDGVKAAKGIIAERNDGKAAVVTPALNDVLDRLLTLVSREVLGAAEARRLEGQLRRYRNTPP